MGSGYPTSGARLESDSRWVWFSSWPGMSQMSFPLERRCGSVNLPAWLLQATRWESGNWITVAKGCVWVMSGSPQPWEGCLGIGRWAVPISPHIPAAQAQLKSGRKDVDLKSLSHPYCVQHVFCFFLFFFLIFISCKLLIGAGGI